MSPAEFERLRQLPRDQLEQLITRALPEVIAPGDIEAQGFVVYERPPSWDEQAGATWYEKRVLPPGDYGPPGDSVYGDFRAGYYPQPDGSVRRLTSGFHQLERHGGWFVENLDTIGPLAVRLFSMAAGAGWLPLPLAEPVEAAGLIAYTPPAAPGGAPVFDFFDQVDDVIGFEASAFDVSSSVADDFLWQGDYFAPDVLGPEHFTDQSMLFPGEPVPPTAFDQLIPGEESWSIVDPMEYAGPALDPSIFPEVPPDATSWGMDPTSAPAAPPTAPAPVFTAPDISLGSVLDQLERGMGQSLRVLATANQLRAVFNQPTTVQPGGVTRTVMADGRIAQRDPAGRVTYTRGAPGVGERATNGDMIVNRGDGTFLRIKPDGRMTTERYPMASAPGGAGLGSMLTSSGGVPPVLLLGAAGLGAYLLLRRR